MNESGVLDHGLRSAHEPPSTSVGGGQRLIAPQHLTPAATAQANCEGTTCTATPNRADLPRLWWLHPLQPSHTTCALPRATRPHHGCPLSPSAEEAQTGLVTITFVTLPCRRQSLRKTLTFATVL